MAPGKRSTRTLRTLGEPALADYEKIRAMNMMKNNQLFQRLGLAQLKSLMTATAANNIQECPQQSESLYDGEDTDGSNEEVTVESQCRKGVRANVSNDGDQISTKVAIGDKRIVAPPQERTIRVTRQRIAGINQETTHNLSVPRQSNSYPATNHESTENLVVPTHPSSNATIDHDPTHNIDIATEPNYLIQEEDDNHNVVEEIIPRRKSMDKQLESLSRGLGMKIPIQIIEGNKRPEPPIQAAKFASEGGITLRQHIPIFHHC